MKILKFIIISILFLTSINSYSQGWKWVKNIGTDTVNTFNRNGNFKKVKPIVFGDTLVYVRALSLFDKNELVWLDANTGNEIKSKPIASLKSLSISRMDFNRGMYLTDFKRDSEGSFYFCYNYVRNSFADTIVFGTNTQYATKINPIDLRFLVKFNKSGDFIYYRSITTMSPNRLGLLIGSNNDVFLFGASTNAYEKYNSYGIKYNIPRLSLASFITNVTDLILYKGFIYATIA